MQDVLEKADGRSMERASQHREANAEPKEAVKLLGEQTYMKVRKGGSTLQCFFYFILLLSACYRFLHIWIKERENDILTFPTCTPRRKKIK